MKANILCLLLSSSIFLCFLNSCSETDTDSYPPTWLGFTYTTGSFSNYTSGSNGRLVTLFLGDSIHLTACQKERGHLINATDYSWTVCYDTLDTKGNDDPNDDVVVHVQKSYYKHTNYDGYTDGADDPVGHLLIPANALPTNSKPDTIKFVARYIYSGQGSTFDNGNIVDNTSYSGKITPQSGPTGGGAAGYFYFNVSEHKYVDLGLPSGTLWATCNVGANSPEDYGKYYAWGEVSVYGKTAYDWAGYKYCNGSFNTMTKYCTDSNYGTVDGKNTLSSTDDAATESWGNSWRMPTEGQFAELINTDYTTTTWLTTQSGTNGRLITSKRNGNSIFLPATGYQDETSLNSKGDIGHYWSRLLDSGDPSYARSLHFDSSGINTGKNSRNCGQPIRPVHI